MRRSLFWNCLNNGNIVLKYSPQMLSAWNGEEGKAKGLRLYKDTSDCTNVLYKKVGKNREVEIMRNVDDKIINNFDKLVDITNHILKQRKIMNKHIIVNKKPKGYRVLFGWYSIDYQNGNIDVFDTQRQAILCAKKNMFNKINQTFQYNSERMYYSVDFLGISDIKKAIGKTTCELYKISDHRNKLNSVDKTFSIC